jgi:hypothetical protein
MPWRSRRQMLSNVAWLTRGSYSYSRSRGRLSYCCCSMELPRPSSPRAHSRPTATAALCGIGEFLSNLRRSSGGGLSDPAPDSTLPFHRGWGRHIHHPVFGIIILLLVGYGWLCELGFGSDHSSIFLSRPMAILYGVGAALTLDEFALWLNLKDVYWSPQGRSSSDAIILFGALFAAGRWAPRCFSGKQSSGS